MRVQTRFPAMLVLVLTSFAIAQPAASGNVPDARAAGRTSRVTDHVSYFGALKDDLGLDDSQQQRIKQLLKAADSDFHAARLEMTPTPEVTRRMAETVKEIEAAKTAGDAAKERELVAERAKLTQGFIEKRDQVVEKMNAVDKMLKRNIAETLRPDQLEKFEAFWPTRHAAALNKVPYDGLIRSAVALKAATDRLGDLTPDQQTQIDAAFKTHQEAMRAAPKPAVEEQALRALYMRVFEVFTDGQRQRVEQELTPKNAPKPPQATSAPAVEPSTAVPAAQTR